MQSSLAAGTSYRGTLPSKQIARCSRAMECLVSHLLSLAKKAEACAGLKDILQPHELYTLIILFLWVEGNKSMEDCSHAEGVPSN
jgi:hypothetical protein